MGNKKAWIGKLLTEFISVVFAVLLALGLNHWREVAAEEAIAEKALLNIFLEIHANNKEIEDEIPSYEERISQVKVFKESFDNGEGMPYSLGFNMPVLSRSAWNVANSTGAIKDFDLKMLMELSDIYTFQEMYHTSGINYMQSMNSVEFKQEANAKAIVNSNYGQLQTYKHWSTQLSTIYKDFIQTYGSQYSELLPDSVLVELDQ